MKTNKSANKIFALSETFESIIGESSFSGFPALFIRFAGCNLRCAWCDTTYAYEVSYFLSHEELFDKIKGSKQKFVLFTGGEPLLQSSLNKLIEDIIINLNKKVILETNGSFTIKDVHQQAHIVLDCKLPSSLEQKKCLTSNYNFIKKTDDIMFVIKDEEDYEYSKKKIYKYNLEKRTNIIFQPAYESLDIKQLSNWIIEDALKVRLGIQLHKYIGVK